ncbi:MAG: hypothetical protein WCW01_04340 [Gammaproteobacteria bacterium]
MYFRRQLVIFISVVIIGTILGLLGMGDFSSTNRIAYFWPGAVVQSVAGVFFGMIGVMAGTTFPIFSDAMSGITLIKVLVWIPANFVQSFIPYLVKKIFKFEPCEFNKKTVICFIVGCSVIPHLVGSIVASLGYYSLHEMATLKEQIGVFLNWITSNISISIIFGLLLLKFFAPALRKCKIYDEMETESRL